jgi:hypothetical protein
MGSMATVRGGGFGVSVQIPIKARSRIYHVEVLCFTRYHSSTKRLHDLTLLNLIDSDKAKLA